MLSTKKIRPFLKWAGNKFGCIEDIVCHFPPGARLIEPFLGSGAVFLNTEFASYILGEQNQILVSMYQLLQNESTDFIEYCRRWFTEYYNTSKQYYQIRDEFNCSENIRKKAAMFLYLNRHGFNGLCRFNSKGKYNVPYGDKKKPYFPEKELLAFAEKAKQAIFINCDYQETFKHAQRGDIIYCDPPYQPLNKSASFTSYTQHKFGFEQQLQLVELAQEYRKKGCHVFISNHDTELTMELYEQAYEIYSLMVSRRISCKADTRQSVKELIAYYRP